MTSPGERGEGGWDWPAGLSCSVWLEPAGFRPAPSSASSGKGTPAPVPIPGAKGRRMPVSTWSVPGTRSLALPHPAACQALPSSWGAGGWPARLPHRPGGPRGLGLPTSRGVVTAVPAAWPGATLPHGALTPPPIWQGLSQMWGPAPPHRLEEVRVSGVGHTSGPRPRRKVSGCPPCPGAPPARLPTHTFSLGVLASPGETGPG